MTTHQDAMLLLIYSYLVVIPFKGLMEELCHVLESKSKQGSQ